MRARHFYHPLKFKVPGGTSRGVLKEKDSWFIVLEDGPLKAVGECSYIRGLNPEPFTDIADVLDKICEAVNAGLEVKPEAFSKHPSIRTGLEMALRDIRTDHTFEYFDSDFITGGEIPINGLVWMGSKSYMRDQINEKIQQGFRCIKLKIAAIDFEEEMALIKYIRNEFGPDEMEIRLDANGGFSETEALDKIKRLSECDIHSIEQPIKPGLWDASAFLCEKSPVDIALDEELIGLYEGDKRASMLEWIKPHYIILKPSLLGGFAAADAWVDLAEAKNLGWWATSALESNVGLAAIAQWVYMKPTSMYQGLGTGQLFTNNIPSPLEIRNAKLSYGKSSWATDFISEN